MKIMKTQHSKIARIVLGIVIVTISWVIFFTDWGRDNRKETLEKYSRQHFEGVVDSIYTDPENFNTKTAILKPGYHLELLRMWESSIKPGDSLSKRKGTLEVEVYRKGTGKVILSYENMLRDWR